MNEQVQVYRRDLTEKHAAEYIHRCGKAPYLALPFAPPPPPEVVEGLRRSTMSAEERLAFVRRWGGEHLYRLPL